MALSQSLIPCYSLNAKPKICLQVIIPYCAHIVLMKSKPPKLTASAMQFTAPGVHLAYNKLVFISDACPTRSRYCLTSRAHLFAESYFVKGRKRLPTMSTGNTVQLLIHENHAGDSKHLRVRRPIPIWRVLIVISVSFLGKELQ